MYKKNLNRKNNLLYLIRHGESLSNIDLTEYERTPNALIELTEQGKIQANEVSEILSKELYDPDLSKLLFCPAPPSVVIWTSPYARAKQTAEIIREKIFYAEFRENLLLIEQNFGIATGAPSTEEYVKGKEEQERLLFKAGRLFTALPQGESKADVALRAEVFLHKLSFIYQHCTNINHIVVSHQGFCHMLEAQITGHIPDAWDWENCEMRKFEHSHGEFRRI